MLRATVRDSSLLDVGDETAGDIRKATVTFREGSTTLCGPLVVELIGAETTVGGVNCTRTLAVGSHVVEVVVAGFYSGSTQALIEVAQPDGSFVTGGLSRIVDTSGGSYAPTVGTEIQAAFNVKYGKNGSNPKGHVDVIFVAGEKTYQVRSTAMESLGIALRTPGGAACAGPPSATCFGVASLRSKATLIDITDPLAPVNVAGNLSLRLAMTDKGSPGSSDTIGISLFNGNTLLLATEWNGAATVEGTLDGGNLVVH